MSTYLRTRQRNTRVESLAEYKRRIRQRSSYGAAAKSCARPRTRSKSSKLTSRTRAITAGWVTGDTEKPSAVLSVIAYDSCGRMVWSQTNGDTDIFGDAGGLIGTADKAAAGCKDVLAKKESRLNRVEPCTDEGQAIEPLQ